MILSLVIEKEENIKLKHFQNLLEYISQSSQYKLSRESHGRRGNGYQRTDQELGLAGNTDTISK